LVGRDNRFDRLMRRAAKLLQDRDQAARLVGALVDHQARAIVTGASGHAGTGDENEPRLVAGMIGDVLGQAR
jgi:hypothetical protein